MMNQLSEEQRETFLEPQYGISIGKWAPACWGTMHWASFLNGVSSEQVAGLIYTIVKVTPCKSCQVHFLEYLSNHPVPVRAPGHSIVAVQKWLVDFHNEVNARTEAPHMTFAAAEAQYRALSEEEALQNLWEFLFAIVFTYSAESRALETPSCYVSLVKFLLVISAASHSPTGVRLMEFYNAKPAVPDHSGRALLEYVYELRIASNPEKYGQETLLNIIERFVPPSRYTHFDISKEERKKLEPLAEARKQRIKVAKLKVFGPEPIELGGGQFDAVAKKEKGEEDEEWSGSSPSYPRISLFILGACLLLVAVVYFLWVKKNSRTLARVSSGVDVSPEAVRVATTSPVVAA